MAIIVILLFWIFQTALKEGSIEYQNLAAEHDLAADSVTEPLHMKAFELRRRHCLERVEVNKRSEEILVTPCDQGEANFVVTQLLLLTDGDRPNDLSIQDYASEHCPGDLGLDLLYFFPTKESWRQGDRTITCIAPQ